MKVWLQQYGCRGTIQASQILDTHHKLNSRRTSAPHLNFSLSQGLLSEDYLRPCGFLLVVPPTYCYRYRLSLSPASDSLPAYPEQFAPSQSRFGAGKTNDVRLLERLSVLIPLIWKCRDSCLNRGDPCEVVGNTRHPIRSGCFTHWRCSSLLQLFLVSANFSNLI